MVESESHGVRELAVELLTSAAGLQALGFEWDALWSATPARTPFQSRAWLSSWWEAFAPGTLWAVAMRHAGRLVGLAPLYRTRTGGTTELRVVGAGNSDYLDLLAAPGFEAAVVECLRRALSDDRDWTVCHFDNLRPASPLLRMDAPGGAEDIRRETDPCPVLSLPAVFDAGRVLGTRMAKDLRYYRRRADRTGTVGIERASRATVHAMLATLFELHAARWATKGSRGVLAAGDVRAFHRAAAPRLFDAGLLRMHALTIDGRTAALYYGLHAADRAFFYLGAFDPAFQSISPGKLVLATALERAMEDGARAFDFLGGREAYKYEWNAIDHPRFRRSIIRH